MHFKPCISKPAFHLFHFKLEFQNSMSTVSCCKLYFILFSKFVLVNLLKCSFCLKWKKPLKVYVAQEKPIKTTGEYQVVQLKDEDWNAKRSASGIEKEN